jgi:hypothetical protein
MQSDRGGQKGMKRWLLAMAVLFGGATAVVHADYVIIRLNLAVTQDPDAEKNQQGGMPGMMGGMPGGMPGMGMGGMPGGMPGMGGLAGRMGGQGGRGAGMGGQGMGGIGPAMGGGAGPGGMPMPGGGGLAGRMGQGGGPPKMGGMGMGGMGMGGMGPPGAGGMGMPGMAGPGGMMGRGGMGSLMTQSAGDEEEDSTPLMVTIIVEVEHNKIGVNKANGRHHITHKWGTTYLPFKGPGFDYTIINNLDTVAKNFELKKKDIKEDDASRADKLLELAQWALAHGLIEKVPEIMADVAKLEPKNPAVVAFQKMQKDMARRPTVDDAAIAWKEKLSYPAKPSKEGHYTLLYEAKIPQKQVDSRLEHLEQNFAGFFYWFALKGRTLPVPTKRLVAVLVKDKEVFDREQKEVFDNIDMVADGFYSRRDNLAVFSAKPIEDGYASLEQITQTNSYKNLSRDDLLRGEKTLTTKDRRNNVNRFDDKAYYETYALIFQAKEAESELATVSYEGTRQLIAAVGLLPRNVEAPEWFDFGVGSFFETPKGSFWPGVGGVNAPYQWNLKQWKTKKSKYWEKNSLEALKAVVTNHYFHEARASKKKEAELTRARTMAWSLTYFLAQQKLDGLLRYYEELASAPRDMELDDDILLSMFARAFGLQDINNPGQLDVAKATDFARKWYKFIDDMPQEVMDAYTKANEKPKQTPRQNAPANAGGGYGGPIQ